MTTDPTTLKDEENGRVPTAPGCEASPSAADGVFAESHPIAQEGVDHGFVPLPLDAPEVMWDGLPRQIMMWLDFDRPTPAKLFQHLRRSGYEVPAWMLAEGELKSPDHVPSKGTRCVLIYRAMVENWLARDTDESPEGEDRECAGMMEPQSGRPFGQPALALRVEPQSSLSLAGFAASIRRRGAL